jgi:hypothetical protein
VEGNPTRSPGASGAGSFGYASSSMAKVPLVPAWMKEEFDSWGRPDGPELVAPSEEDNILIAEGLAEEWNGRCIPIEVLERRVRNALRREKRRQLKEAEAQAKLEAAAKAGPAGAAPGAVEPAGQAKPASRTKAPARPKSTAAAKTGAGTTSPRKKIRIEIGREQLGLLKPDRDGSQARSRRS